ncbi:MAG TPA: ferrous iron transport protein B [Candidatus Alistipes intestinigallinarum]|uniref:Ferrous iron transport protein B n=1 Tax=Candidatus Alistipes intestinigallinarum TaxID=2838440 RepID=A0A9D1Z0J7_9BACT|nr:ferrous iron transport protein B [Candidatus Alistipes intestinigallinarum]
MRLSELKSGESATIVKIMGHGGFRRRIMEMGFVRGERVEVILNAPLKDPIEYRIMGYDISLRRSEAEMVEVLSDSEADEYLARRAERIRQAAASAQASDGSSPQTETPDEDGCSSIEEVLTRQSRTIAVALVGNPNSGKTSLFNAISGGHEHVGNYSGVTVGAKSGHCLYRGYRFEITDLPGTYALSAYTPEERYVRHHLATKTPDVVINSVVASNIERNLYLTTELIDINPRMVVALNMFDELQASGARLDYDSLGRMMGVPMVPVEARNNKGINDLLDTVIDVYENRDERVRHIHINMGPVIDESLRKLNGDMSLHREELPKAFPPRYWAMKMLESDRQAEEMLRGCERYPVWSEIRDREAKRIADALGEDVETAFANQKYGFIQGALKETFTPGKNEEVSATALIDTFVTHKLWGFPIFFALMGLMFWCTFSLGAYPQAWIEALVGWIGAGVDALMPAGALRDMLVDGIIGGVGSVIVFLPNIMILYLFIAFMEDSGYLARAAFIMDRVMHRIGVHGKSFIPLVMGFGCNVPAIMACRTIESRSSRLITILITPFMSCSARIPIYILLTATFFSANAGAVMLGLYVLGILLAVVTARLMRRFLFPVDETPFVMELPPYRLPTWKTTLTHMWDKCAQYLKKMGGMILIASIIVWALSYYPRTKESVANEAHYENSYLGRIGKGCEPLFEPLGFNWKASVALLSGLPAKEIVVSTLGVLYAEEPEQAAAAGAGCGSAADAAETLPSETIGIIGGADGPTSIVVADAAEEPEPEELSEEEEAASLSRRLLASGDFSKASALAFLVFILLYVPCIATVVAIGSEAGWKWAVASIFYNTAVAWVVAWVVYHIASIF